MRPHQENRAAQNASEAHVLIHGSTRGLTTEQLDCREDTEDVTVAGTKSDIIGHVDPRKTCLNNNKFTARICSKIALPVPENNSFQVKYLLKTYQKITVFIWKFCGKAHIKTGEIFFAGVYNQEFLQTTKH